MISYIRVKEEIFDYFQIRLQLEKKAFIEKHNLCYFVKNKKTLQQIINIGEDNILLVYSKLPNSINRSKSWTHDYLQNKIDVEKFLAKII